MRLKAETKIFRENRAQAIAIRKAKLQASAARNVMSQCALSRFHCIDSNVTLWIAQPTPHRIMSLDTFWRSLHCTSHAISLVGWLLHVKGIFFCTAASCSASCLHYANSQGVQRLRRSSLLSCIPAHAFLCFTPMLCNHDLATCLLYCRERSSRGQRPRQGRLKRRGKTPRCSKSAIQPPSRR